jgi:hypothetical protein
VIFKGTKVNCCEIIFNPKEQYRMKYNPSLMTLFESLRQELWKARVFPDLIALILEVCRAMPSFAVEVVVSGEKRKVSNNSIALLAEQAGHQYSGEDYFTAVTSLTRIVAEVEQVPEFDRLVLRYLKEVYRRFELLTVELDKRLEQEVDSKIDVIFNPQYKTAYLNAKKYLGTYAKLKTLAMSSTSLGNKKSIWYSLIEDNKEDLTLEIYSGKR